MVVHKLEVVFEFLGGLSLTVLKNTEICIFRFYQYLECLVQNFVDNK